MANLLTWSAEAFNLSGFEIKSAATIDAVEFHSGTHSMKIASSGAQQDQGYQSSSGNAWSIVFGGSYFYRWWMKCGDLVWSNQNKFKANRWLPLGILTGYLGKAGVWPGEHSGGFSSDQGAGTGGEGPTIAYDFDTATNPAVKNWQEYIVEFKIQSVADALDGWMKFYVNGVLVGSLTGVRWWSGSPSGVREAKAGYMMWNFPQNVSGNIWIDEVSVDTLWNSNFSAPPNYELIVTDGTGDGLYAQGAVVAIAASVPSGSTFSQWTGNTQYLANVTAMSTTVTMPAQAVSVAATWVTNAITNTIWSDNFDLDRLSSYFEYTNPTGKFVRDVDQVFAGTHSMRCEYTVGTSENGNLKIGFGKMPAGFTWVDSGTRIYRYAKIRFRHYLSSPWVHKADNLKCIRFNVFTDASWSQAAIGHIWTGGTNNYHLQLDPASGTDVAGVLQTSGWNDLANFRWLGITVGTTALFDPANAGQWVLIEAEMRLNDPGFSNGEFRFWINGTVDAEQTGLNWLGMYQTYGINAVHLETYWNNGAPAIQRRYFDEFEVLASPIPPASLAGCLIG